MGVITLGLGSKQKNNQYFVIAGILSYDRICHTLRSIAVRNTNMESIYRPVPRMIFRWRWASLKLRKIQESWCHTSLCRVVLHDIHDRSGVQLSHEIGWSCEGKGANMGGCRK